MVSDSGSVKGPVDSRVDALLRETERKLHRQNQVVVDLAKRSSVQTGDLDQALRDIAEAAADALEVDRVSVWFFTEDRQALHCAEEYVSSRHEHTSGAEISIETSPVYFHVLEHERTVSVHDADKDPRMAAFTEETLRSSGIRSTIDASIRRFGRVTGVVRHTAMARRQWTVDEENFAASIADLVVIAIDAAEQRATQQSLEHRLEFERVVSRISTRIIDLAAGDLDDAIVSALASVGNFVNADRAYLLLLDSGGETASMTHEWCAPGVDRRAESMQRIPLAVFPWISSALEALRPLRIERLEDLPREAMPERALLESFAIKSLLAIPIAVHKNLLGVFGAVCLKETRWEEETVGLLRLVAEIIAGAINRSRTEKALRASEVRYRVLFERNVAGVYRNTVDGHVLDCNEAMARMLGYKTREEVLALNAKDMYFDSSERERFIEQLRRERSINGLEVQLRRHDNDKPLWLLESVHLIDGQPETLEGTAIDITDRKLAEMAFRESESRYRTVIEQMREGLAQVDNEGVFQLVNDRFCEMFGYSREELVGTCTEELLVASPENAALLREKAEARKRGVSEQYELQMRRKDGSVIWVEIGGAPLFGGRGNIVGWVGIHDDVTERRRTAEALRESEMRYRLLADHSTDLISRLSARGTILYSSPAVESLLGFESAELAGHSVFDFIKPEDHDVVRLATLTLARRGTITFSYRVVGREGTEVWFETTCRGIRDPRTKKMTEIVSVSRDITERKRVEDHIEFQAYHDDLTKLPNRTLFRDRLTVALAYARRTHRPLAVLFMDLDRFKAVNDTLGHSLGDELLKVIAGRLSATIRAEDTVARLGGDEFTVLATNLWSADDASLVAQKVLETIGEPVTIDGHELFVTASIGIAIYPQDGENVEALLKNADVAMYRAKESGRNAYVLCTPEMNRRAAERLTLESALRHAVHREEFFLLFQPLVRLGTMQIAGFEALLRWNRPGHGVIEPAEFLGIADETRMIVPLGHWILREACRAAKSWQTKHPSARLSLNLSMRQFQHNEFPPMIVAALEESKLDPSLLEVEVTEGVATLNVERSAATMRSLRKLGVRIAVDDFGSGPSWLNYLHNFPIDAVKIDRRFVGGIDASSGDRAIISGVIAMVRGLSLRVIADGVETQAQLDFLRNSGCDEAQGLLLGGPVTADAI